MFQRYHPTRVAGRRSIGIITLALMAMLLPACAKSGPQLTVRDRNVTAQAVSQMTNALIGQRVTVRGEIKKLVSGNAFTINDEQMFEGQEILVVNASSAPFTLPDDDIELQVTGEVRKFNIANLAKEFDLSLQPEAYLDYKDRPVIIAQSIALAPKPAQIVRNPTVFYNQPVAVEAEVEKVLDPIAFTLQEDQVTGGSDLLVLNPKAGQPMRAQQNVVVTGVIRPFVVSQIERDYNLTRDLQWQKTVEAQYKNKPVLIAQQIFSAEQ